MILLAQEDLAGARAVVATASTEVEPTLLVAAFGNYWDLYWVLDDAQQRLLLQVPLSVFDGDRGTWGIVLAQTYHLRGDDAKARLYADTARVGYQATLKATPNDPTRHALLGLALAYLGHNAAAIREGQRAVALAPVAQDSYLGPYEEHLLTRIYILTGDHEKALDRLEHLLRIPYFLSPGWLRVDPTFEPLRGNPRFVALAGGAS